MNNLVIAQVQSKDDVSAAQALFREYMDWTNTLGFDSSEAPTFDGFEEEVATLPGIYAPPRGRLLLARYGLEPAGCVALRPHGGGTCELKRLYVRPAFRGLRVGWLLVERLLEDARQSGYGRMVLDSHRSMRKAHEIYAAHGFKTVDPPDDFPESLKPVVVFMECDLVATPR
jgi:GNAT superfamily N-acetyltransferase